MAKLQTVSDSIVGRDAVLRTPFGERPLVYADYGASGRMSTLVEERLAGEAALYANPHNEDSTTGHAATAALHDAVARIKRSVGADERHALIACGSGATAGVHRLQEILGVAIPPATKAFMDEALTTTLDEQTRQRVLDRIALERPVVFIGPYEHHSNELSWRESLAEVVAIGLDRRGHVDFAELEAKLADPRYARRRKIGAFSAASNVTGVKTDVRRLSALLHRHGAILALDCAASAPYLPVNMADDGVDAAYISPHKMVGGPGACGLLLINKALYRADLAPSCCGGGTVRYVSPRGHDFIEDVEARERAGTPGLPQLQRAAVALEMLTQIGWDEIAAREHTHLEAALDRLSRCDGVQLYGPVDADQRIGLVSFNLRTNSEALIHPKLVARLLNDLFGIQTRAGCSCAGPYGHHLLALDDVSSALYRDAVMDGYAGLRPGWVRVSLHWSMTEAERDYLIDALCFLAANADRFLSAYRFEPASGHWQFVDGDGASRLYSSCGGARLRGQSLKNAEGLARHYGSKPIHEVELPARFSLAGPIAGLAFNSDLMEAAE